MTTLLKINLSPSLFRHTIILDTKFFQTYNSFSDLKLLCTSNLFTFFWDPNYLLSDSTQHILDPRYFWTQNFWDPNFFRPLLFPRIFFTSNFFWINNFIEQKILQTQIFFNQIFFYLNILWSQIFLQPQNLF